MARIGKDASMPSALPLFSGTVMSVIHALKAASLLVEPIKVMTQSIMMTTDTDAARIFTSSARPKSFATLSLEMKAKTMTENPHRM